MAATERAKRRTAKLIACGFVHLRWVKTATGDRVSVGYLDTLGRLEPSVCVGTTVVELERLAAALCSLAGEMKRKGVGDG